MSRLLLSLIFSVLVFAGPINALAQWSPVFQTPTPSSYVFEMITTDTDFFIGTDVDGIFVWDAGGNTWNAVNTGLTDKRVHSIAVSGTTLFAGTLGGVFRSTDNGANWTAVNTGLTSLSIYPLVVDGTTLFTGGHNGGMFRSTDEGETWVPINNGLTDPNINSIVVVGTDLFAATNDGVFRSSDDGANWVPVSVGMTNKLVTWITAHNTDLYATTYGGGVFRSTNRGVSWTAVNTGLTDPLVLTLLAHDNDLFAGTNDSGVFHSPDNGANWTNITEGTPGMESILSFIVVGDDLYAGTSTSGATGVWRRPLSEMVTSIEKIAGSEIPIDVTLEQNYPNPFKTESTVELSVPETDHMRLVIYDLLGAEQMVLVDRMVERGVHRVSLDASNLVSGAYFYRLETGGVQLTRKMLIVK